MKTLRLTTLLLGLALVFGSTSCKYEEGPALSLRTKKARVAGEWRIEKYVDANGNEDVVSDSPVITYDKDGSGTISYTIGGVTTSENFKWEFSNSKKDMKTTYDGDVYTEKIIRLTNKEFWTEDEDGEQTHLEAK